jgi:hypothetical protein
VESYTRDTLKVVRLHLLQSPSRLPESSVDYIAVCELHRTRPGELEDVQKNMLERCSRKLFAVFSFMFAVFFFSLLWFLLSSSLRDTPERSVDNPEVCDLHRGLRGILRDVQESCLQFSLSYLQFSFSAFFGFCFQAP